VAKICDVKREISFPYHGETALSGAGPTHSRSHSDTSHSVGLLWRSDQPDANTAT